MSVFFLYNILIFNMYLFISGKFIKCKFVASTDSSSSAAVADPFHLSTILHNHRYHLFMHKFCVFFKLRFSEKIFSSWLLACHKIILPVWMLKLFFHIFLLPGKYSTIPRLLPLLDFCRLSTCQLAIAVGMFLGARISSNHFPSFENVENFVLS